MNQGDEDLGIDHVLVALEIVLVTRLDPATQKPYSMKSLAGQLHAVIKRANNDYNLQIKDNLPAQLYPPHFGFKC